MQVVRLIMFRYWVALALIAAALTGSYVLLGRALEVQRESFRIVSLAAEQSFATQRVCFLSHAAVNANDPDSRREYRAALEEAAAHMARQHEVLSLRRDPEDLPQGMRTLLRSTYYDDPEPLDGQVNELLRDARTIVNAAGEDLNPAMTELLRMTRAGNQALANRQQQLFKMLREEARNSVDRIRFLGTSLWLLTLALVVVEVPLIFRPMARRAGRTLAGLEAARRKAESEARTAEVARESQANFTRTVSHELRTPLNAILGMTQMLKLGTRPEKQDEYARDIHQAGRHLLDLINDILELNRLEAGQIVIEPAPMSLKEELEGTISMLRTLAAEKSLGLDFRIHPGLARYYLTDGPRIRQILINLVGNALKFTEHGSISVSVSYEGSAGAAADLVRFEVRDTGIGVPPELRKRIFEEFQQADNALVREQGGSGLGLTISSRLVKLMGGEIGVDSIDGEGSVFWFTLPLKWMAASWPEPKADVSLLTVPGRLRVLMMDSDGPRREHVETRLRRTGHAVLTASTSSEALAAAMESLPDVVLIDVDTFGLDAAAVTRALRELPGPLAGALIIGLASNESGSAAEAIHNAGADLCLGKPLDFEELRSHLDQHGPRQDD